jgi:hypothetical protein
VSGFLLVAMHADLDNLPGEPRRTTRSAVFRGVLRVPGVQSVTDLEVISPDTLKEWCLSAEQSLALTRTRRKRKRE